MDDSRLLFHYTNAKGLHGILTDKCLWATDYRFLNDTSEFSYGWKIVSGAIKQRRNDIYGISPNCGEHVDRLLEKFSNLEDNTFWAFIFSLSEVGDQLSQWRGYCSGKGFSIGFERDWINAAASSHGFEVVPVEYREGEQHSIAHVKAELIVNSLREAASQTPYDADALDACITRLWKHILVTTLAFKKDSFHEEREYRIIYISSKLPKTVEVRTSPAGVIPYLTCRLDKNDAIYKNVNAHNFGVRRIIVGPALRPQQRCAVETFTKSLGMELEVCPSDIPYAG